MKKALLLTVILASTQAFAIDWGLEVFTVYKSTTAETKTSQSGVDLERMRVLTGHKFNDAWSFSGKFEVASGTTGAAFDVKEAAFSGKSLLMENDTFTFGAQGNPFYKSEGILGTGWIYKDSLSTDDSKVVSWQSGASYTMNFGMPQVTLYSLSAEKAGQNGSDDQIQDVGAHLNLKISDETNFYAQHSTTTPQVTANTYSKFTGLGVSYKTETLGLNFEYLTTSKVATAKYTLTDPEKKADTVMGLYVTAKATETMNIYAHYFGGYEAYKDTGETKGSKLMVGPSWKLDGDKLNLGVFYEAIGYQADAKSNDATLKDYANYYIKMAAKF